MSASDGSPGRTADYLPQVTDVLKALSLLPKEDVQQAEGTTAAIEDFTLEITKKTQALIKWGAAGGAGAGIVSGIVSAVKSQSDSLLAAIIGSTAIVLAAGLLALARVMDGDVRTRGSAGTASIEARGAVAQTMLTQLMRTAPGSATTDQPAPSEQQLLLAIPRFRHLKVTVPDGEFEVVGARWRPTDGKVQLKLSNGDWELTEKITGFAAETN